MAALLANGAEPNALDSSGFSPLARAIQGKHDATIKVGIPWLKLGKTENFQVLLANGASAMTGGGAEYGSPVFWSVIGNEPIIIETLVRGSNAYAPCSVNLRSPSGLTLLHVASKCVSDIWPKSYAKAYSVVRETWMPLWPCCNSMQMYTQRLMKGKQHHR